MYQIFLKLSQHILRMAEHNKISPHIYLRRIQILILNRVPMYTRRNLQYNTVPS